MGFLVIGICLLGFGFIEFNAGSAFESSERAGIDILITNIPATVAKVTWMIVQRTLNGKPTIAGVCDGANAMLVGINPVEGLLI